MRVIILGASGQVGSAIYHGLRHECEVVGTSRRNSGAYRRFDPFKDDWSELGPTDVLINAVGQINATRESPFEHVHVELTKRIIRNRDTIGRPRIIQISALGASPDHKVEFLRTKGIADEMLLAQPDTKVLRPSIVCTPDTMIVRKMLMLARIARYCFKNLLTPAQLLETRIQPVMPQDLVDVVRISCSRDTESLVNIAGPDQITFREIIAMLSTATAQKIRTVELPKKLADLLVHRLVIPLFPETINTQQYQLLFEDNIDNSAAIERILKRPSKSTKQFFIDEFRNACN